MAASIGTVRRGDKGDEDEDVDEDVSEDNVGNRWRWWLWWRYQRRMVVVTAVVAGRVRLGVGVGERRRRLGPKRGVACVAELAATYKRRGASTATAR